MARLAKRDDGGTYEKKIKEQFSSLFHLFFEPTKKKRKKKKILHYLVWRESEGKVANSSPVRSSRKKFPPFQTQKGKN